MSPRKIGLFVMIAMLTAVLAPVRAAELNPGAPYVRVLDQSLRRAAAMDGAGRLHSAALGPATATSTEVRVTTVVDGTPGPAVTVATLVGVHNEPRPLALATGGNILTLAYNLDYQRVCYRQRPLDGGAWSEQACVTSPSTLPPLVEIDVAVLADGTVAVAWQHDRLGVALRRPNGVWEMLPDPAGDDPRERTQPRLVVVDDALTAVWVQRREDGPGSAVRTELLGRSYTAGRWGAPVSISGFDPGMSQWNVRDPAIVASEGTLHIAYVLFAPGETPGGPRNQIFYRRGSLEQLSPADTMGQDAANPSLAVQGSRIEMAWSTPVGTNIGNFPIANREIVWSRRDAGWSAPRNISSTAGPSLEPALFIGQDGRSSVIWQDSFDGPVQLLKQTDSTGAWADAPAIDAAALQSYTERADRPVATGAAARSWLWGPERWATERESYVEAAGATREVFYYDKARVEISDPNRRSDDPAYFTNGLLVTELASGRVQYADQFWIGREPATVPIAGDTGNTVAPTYSSFRSLVYIPDIGQRNEALDRTGQRVNQCVDRAGAVRPCAPATATTYAFYVEETRHNIAAPFWTFLNQSGPLYENGRFQSGLVFAWVATMGYPLTEPYWTRAVVGGVERDVLIQLFQRRVLSYTPGNPVGFEVEMGNVGQHYYQWRYGTTPWLK